MAALGASSSAPPSRDKGVGPSGPLPHYPSEAFPPLPPSSAAAQAKSRRVRADQRRADPRPNRNATAGSKFPYSAPANSNINHPFGDTWPAYPGQLPQNHVLPDAALWRQSNPAANNFPSHHHLD